MSRLDLQTQLSWARDFEEYGNSPVQNSSNSNNSAPKPTVITNSAVATNPMNPFSTKYTVPVTHSSAISGPFEAKHVEKRLITETASSQPSPLSLVSSQSQSTANSSYSTLNPFGPVSLPVSAHSSNIPQTSMQSYPNADLNNTYSTDSRQKPSPAYTSSSSSSATASSSSYSSCNEPSKKQQSSLSKEATLAEQKLRNAAYGFLMSRISNTAATFGQNLVLIIGSPKFKPKEFLESMEATGILPNYLSEAISTQISGHKHRHYIILSIKPEHKALFHQIQELFKASKPLSITWEGICLSSIPPHSRILKRLDKGRQRNRGGKKASKMVSSQQSLSTSSSSSSNTSSSQFIQTSNGLPFSTDSQPSILLAQSLHTTHLFPHFLTAPVPRPPPPSAPMADSSDTISAPPVAPSASDDDYLDSEGSSSDGESLSGEEYSRRALVVPQTDLAKPNSSALQDNEEVIKFLKRIHPQCHPTAPDVDVYDDTTDVYENVEEYFEIPEDLPPPVRPSYIDEPLPEFLLDQKEEGGKYSRYYSVETVYKNDHHECPICLDNFPVHSNRVRLLCFCVVHRHCIDSWFDKHHNTPQCPVHKEIYDDAIKAGLV